MFVDLDFLNKAVEGAAKAKEEGKLGKGLTERQLLALSKSSLLSPFGGGGGRGGLLGMPSYYATKTFEDKLRKRRDQRRAKELSAYRDV